MNKYSIVDSNEKASAFMEARLWEFIDMAAAWPKAKPDSRIWDHVLVYAPKKEWVGLTLREIEECIYDANDDPIVACRNVEAKLKERNHD